MAERSARSSTVIDWSRCSCTQAMVSAKRSEGSRREAVPRCTGPGRRLAGAVPPVDTRVGWPSRSRSPDGRCGGRGRCSQHCRRRSGCRRRRRRGRSGRPGVSGYWRARFSHSSQWVADRRPSRRPAAARTNAPPPERDHPAASGMGPRKASNSTFSEIVRAVGRRHDDGAHFRQGLQSVGYEDLEAGVRRSPGSEPSAQIYRRYQGSPSGTHRSSPKTSQATPRLERCETLVDDRVRDSGAVRRAVDSVEDGSPAATSGSWQDRYARCQSCHFRRGVGTLTMGYVNKNPHSDALNKESTLLTVSPDSNPQLVSSRNGRRSRMAARLLAFHLDDQLARGGSPESNRLLAARAQELVAPDMREEVSATVGPAGWRRRQSRWPCAAHADCSTARRSSTYTDGIENVHARIGRCRPHIRSQRRHGAHAFGRRHRACLQPAIRTPSVSSH